MKRFIGNRKRGIVFACCYYVLSGIGLILSLSVFKKDVCLPCALGIFLIGIIGYGVFLLNKQVERKGVRLSSRLTALYDFFIPLTILAALLADILILAVGLNSPEVTGVLVFLIFIGIMALGVVYLMKLCRLKTLYVFEKKIFVSDFFWEEDFKTSEIKEFSQWLSTTYRLKVERDGKCHSYVILPSAPEGFAYKFCLIDKTTIDRFIEKYNLVSKKKRGIFRYF